MSAEVVWNHEEEESLESGIAPRDPLTEMHDEVERRTNPTAVSLAREKARATRRTLYLLISGLVGLLLNVFGIFLYVTFSDRIAPSSIWYLWVDGLVSGITIVYTLGLVRTLHEALAVES